MASNEKRHIEEEFQSVTSENHDLKVALNAEKDKVKKLAAKLIKSMAGKSEHEIESEESNNKIAELEKDNRILKSRLQSAKAQLEAYTRLPLAPGVKGYLSSMRSSTPKNVWVAGPRPQHWQVSPVLAPSEILHTTLSPVAPSLTVSQPPTSKIWDRNANAHQIDSYERELTNMRQKLHEKQSTVDDLSLRIATLETSGQRTEIQENIELIKIQKQLKQKSSESIQLQAKYQKAEQDLRILKGAHDSLLSEFDQMNNTLRREQNMNVQMQSQLRSYESTHDTSSMRTNQEIQSIQRENEILKDANEKLLANALNNDRESEWIKTESTLRSKISQMENAIKADVNTRNELLERLASEIGRRETCEQEMHQAETKQLQLKAELERLQRRMASLTQDGIEWERVEDALNTIKQNKGTSDGKADFLQNIRQENKGLEEEMQSMKVSFAEAVQELEKTRNLLIAQNKINREYQSETESIARQADYHKREYERQLQEYAKKLDERAKRIHRLENYIQDIAYGRKPTQVDRMDEAEEQEPLESGQNLMEVHVNKIDLKSDALRYMLSNAPSLFLTIDIFDFETQITPVIKGPKADVSFTFQYYVIVSDLFVYYLSKETATIELHQVVGSTYKTWAAGTLHLKDLLSALPGRLFYGIQLNGVAHEAVGTNFGTVEVNIALKLPISRALAMYKERAKAIGLVGGEGAEEGEAEQSNILLITIHRLRGLSCKYKNEAGPSSYIMYRVFDFADHDSAIINSNPNPELNDSYAWSLPVGNELDTYLKTQSLNVMVFDDSAPSDDLSYIGYASIPLIPLAHNKPIMGTFPVLQDHDTKTKSTIDVSLNWKYAYISVPDQLFVTEPEVVLGPEKELIPKTEDKSLEHMVVKTAKPKPRIEKPSEPETQASQVHAHMEPPVTQIETILTPPPVINQLQPIAIPMTPVLSNQDLPPEYDYGKEKSEHYLKQTYTATAEDEEHETDKASSSLTDRFTDKGENIKDVAGGSNGRMERKVVSISSTPASVSTSSTPRPRPRKGSYTLPTQSASSVNTESVKSMEGDKRPAPAPPPRHKKVVVSNDDVVQALREEINDEDHSHSTTHDEDIVVGKEPAASVEKRDTEVYPDIIIGVHSLKLTDRSPLIATDESKKTKVFIEWKTDDDRSFLGLPPELCETSESLYLPTQSDQELNFDHVSKVEMDNEKLLLLKETASKDRTLHFVLVSDPEDDEDADCDEFGLAEVTLRALTSAGDLVHEDIDVVDTKGKRIAKLNVTVQAKEALEYAINKL